MCTCDVIWQILINFYFNQVLALLNVDFTKASSKTADHLKELIEQIRQNKGLEYCPREQTPQGR